MTVVLSFVIGLLVTAPGPDLEFVADPPKDPAKLAVPDKVTIVVVRLEGCGACKVFVKQASVIAASNPKLAIRAVDGAHDNTLKYMPPQAPVPFARVYDLQGKERYAGPVDDGQLVKEAILAGLGTSLAPILGVQITRLAPARISFCSVWMFSALAMIVRSSFSPRAVRVTNTLSASPVRHAARPRASSIRADCSNSSLMASPLTHR